MQNKKFKKIEMLFVSLGFFFTAVLAFSMIYSFNFLSSALVDAFSIKEETSPPVNFDIESFKQLDL